MISRVHRFHGYGSLRYVYQRGKTFRNGFIALKSVDNPRRTQYRAAVVVSKKVNKSAVVRNRIRRRIYEIIRQQAIIEEFSACDLVFTVFNEQCATMDPQELRDIIVQLLEKADIAKNGAATSVARHDIVKTEETSQRYV